MQTLINVSEKRERDYAKRRLNRLYKNGITFKQHKIRERQKKVKKLHNEGFNQTQIAYKLSMGQSTVNRDLYS